MESLYLLSFLLTADDALAERCFVQGLHDARNGNRVFKDWAESWSRRTVIMNAIRAVRPSPESSVNRSTSRFIDAEFLVNAPQIRALVDLPSFDRFVFVVTVLEGYSDRECALLLGSTRETVVAARVRTLERLGDSKTVQDQLHTIEADQQLRQERSLVLALSPQAVSA